MTTTLATINEFTLLGSDSLAITDDEFAPVLDAHRERLTESLAKLKSGIAATQQDENLTGQGKGEKIQRLATTARSEINRIDLPPAVPAALEKVERELPATLPIPRETAGFSVETRLRYVLDRLIRADVSKDPLMMQGILRDAAVAGDPEPIIAAQRAPRSVLSVPPELIAEVVGEYHERHNPKAWERREMLLRVQQLLESNLKTARSMVDSLAGPDLRTPA